MRFGPLAFLACAAVSLALAGTSPAPAPAEKPVAAKPVAAKPDAAKPEAPKALTGKITTPDGKPALGATVRAIPVGKSDVSMRGPVKIEMPKASVAKTDATGSFRIDGLPAGPFAVRVEAAGFAPAFASDVPAGAAVNLRLKPGVPVVGRVLDLLSQKPVAGATVTALERDGARFGRDAAQVATSGEDGTFRFANVAPGVVALEAIAPAKAKARLDRVIAKAVTDDAPPKPEANTLFLQPGGRIAGRVLGPDGKPLADAVVTTAASDGALFTMLREGRGAQRTDAGGKFAFEGVVAGNKYTVRATKDGLSSREEGPIAIDAGADRSDILLSLESGATLAFRLVTAADVPVKDVEARVQQASRKGRMSLGSGDVDRDKIVSQGDGKFLIKALDAGTFDVVLQPPDFADVAREAVKLKSGETTDLGTIRVKESKSIAGRITDSSGQPVVGAAISGMWMDSEFRLSREAKSGADGRYRLAGLGDQPLRNVNVRATGFSSATREGATVGDTAVDFTLERTGTIVGRVLLPGGAAPAAFRVKPFAEASDKQAQPGFRVVIGGSGDDEQLFTDPSGSFRLENVDPGPTTIVATADGKAPARKQGLTVAADQIVDVGTLTLEDGRVLRGRIVAAKDDAPVPGATVSLSQPQGFMMSSGRDSSAGIAISALDGRFEIAGLEPHAYAVDVNQPDYSPNSGRVEIAPDADTDDFVVKLSRGGTLTGLVRDAQKQIVSSAGVLLLKIPMGGGPQTVTTGPDGRYTFEKVTPGEYRVIRAPSGGGPLMLMGGMKMVAVREGETTTFDLDEAAKINLSGRVLKGGQPVANSMLIFSIGEHGSPGGDMKQSRTDGDGRYQVGLDTPGTYTVSAPTGGVIMRGARSGVAIQVPDQPNPVQDITMRSSGISGHVLNTEGKPVAGAMIMASAADAPAGQERQRSASMSDHSDPDGSFLIEGMDPGTYKVSVSASGYRTFSAPPVTVADESDVAAVDVRLEPGRTVRGRVVDANGNGIAGAYVMAASTGAPPLGRDFTPSTSDVNGSFLVTAPADGPIDITAVASGFPVARALGVEPSEGDSVTVRAPRPGQVKVSVLDGQGRALAGAHVACRAVPDYLGAGYQFMLGAVPPSAADGTATVSSLAPGTYELTVTAGAKKATQAVTLGEGAEVAATVTLN